MDTKKNLVFFTRYTADAPVSRYRSYAQKNNLDKNGFRCALYPFYSSAVSRKWYEKGKSASAVSVFFASLKRLLQLLFLEEIDIVVIEYPLLMGTSHRLQNWLLRKQKHIVADLVYLSSDEKENRGETEALLSAADVVISPHVNITKRVLATAKEIIQIPPCVSLHDYTLALPIPATIQGAETNTFRIGWTGTATTSEHLLLIKDCLVQLHDLYHIQLVLIGFDKKREKELQGLPYTIYVRSGDAEISLLKTCDVAVLPLPDALLSVEASAFSMIQYMACGLPVAATSNEITIGINHGNENLFARTTFEWYSCLAAMIQNKAFYKETGKKNQMIAADFYSLEQTQKNYLSLVQNLLDNS